MDILKQIKDAGHNFTGKHDGKPIFATRIVDVGINPGKQVDWIKVAFTEVEGGKEQLLRATQPLLDAPGKRGGNDHITLDDKPVGPYPADQEDFVAGLQFTLWPPGAHIVVAFKYHDDSGAAHRYEFSAPAPIPLPF